MSSIKSIGRYGIYSSDIDVNLLKLDNKEVSRKRNSIWEMGHNQKKGFLNQILDWSNADLEIIGLIDKASQCNKAVLKINCNWTNFYNQIELNKTVKNNQIEFTSLFNLDKNLVSSEVTFSIDFFNNGNLVGESKVFQVFVDHRIKPEIDSSQFKWEFYNFEKESHNEIPTEFRNLIQSEFLIKGQQFLSFFATPDEINNKLRIIVNESFPGIDENLFDSDEKLPEQLVHLRDLLEMYYRSNAYMVQFMNTTFIIKDLGKKLMDQYEKEEITEQDLKAKVYDEIKEEFSSELNQLSFELINFLSVKLFPKDKTSEIERIYKWWSLSHRDSNQLIERFNLAFQTIFDPAKKLRGFEKFAKSLVDMQDGSTENIDENMEGEIDD
tara:strand:+ start:1261 stop:2406 length:1146 start_codon:yes stop_codon:yes gene_type:complete